MQTVGPEKSFKAGLGAMEIACSAMEIAATQTLCEDEASLEAGLHTQTYIHSVTHEQKTCYTSRFVCVILAQGPC